MWPPAMPTVLVGGLWRSRRLGLLEASVETVSRRNLKGRVKAEVVEAAVAVRVRRVDGFMLVVVS